jgi:hypothetical protein
MAVQPVRKEGDRNPRSVETKGRLSGTSSLTSWKKYSDFLQRGLEDDEFAVRPKQAQPTLVTEQTFFIKRAGDQVFVTITNEADNFFGVLLALGPVDPEETTAKQTKDEIERLVHVEPGKCKFV